MSETTLRAGLARVSRVYCDHAHTRFFGLVLQEGAQLPERPCVQPSLPLSPAQASALADVCEVFNNDSSPSNSRLNDTLRQYVVSKWSQSGLNRGHNVVSIAVTTWSQSRWNRSCLPANLRRWRRADFDPFDCTVPLSLKYRLSTSFHALLPRKAPRRPEVTGAC